MLGIRLLVELGTLVKLMLLLCMFSAKAFGQREVAIQGVIYWSDVEDTTPKTILCQLGFAAIYRNTERKIKT